MVAVGRAHGVNLPADYAEQRIPFFDGWPPEMTASMHHDLNAGKPLELRWLSGGVVDLGAKVGVPTPMNRAVRDILAFCMPRAGRLRRIDGTTMTETPSLTIRVIRAIGVEMPMTYALGTSRAVITKAPLLLIDLDTEEGITGRSYLWCYLRDVMPAIAAILAAVEAIEGEPVEPLIFGTSSRSGLHSSACKASSHGDVGFRHGSLGRVAIAAGMPLATLVGGKPNRFRAYNSCGLGPMPPERSPTSREALASGFRAVKLRLGYPTLAGGSARFMRYGRASATMSR